MNKQLVGAGVVVVALLSIVSVLVVNAVSGNTRIVTSPTSTPPPVVKKVAPPSPKTVKKTDVAVKPQYVNITANQVKRGDNLTLIAHRNGVTLAQVARLNPQIQNLNLIYPGQRIRIK